MTLHVCCSAGTHVLSKAAIMGFESAVLTMLRAAGAAVLLLCLTGSLFSFPRFSWREWRWVAVLGVMLVFNQYFYVRGLDDTVPSHPALFYAMTPLGVLILSAIQRKSWPSARLCLGVALAFAGVLFVLRPWQAGALAARARRGDLWIIGAVLLWVVYTVMAGRLLRRHDARVLTAWSLILGALAFVPWGARPVLDADLHHVPFKAWLGLCWMILITSVGMMILWNSMLRFLEPVQVAICANAQPPATVALAAALNSVGLVSMPQDLGAAFWIGMFLTLGGVYLVQLVPGSRIGSRG